jgi:MoaA/NifB/PqqE/SkfB family radical SAM enzyme
MTVLFPATIDFRIIGRCNLRCPFCFGPRHDLRAMRLDDSLELLDLMARYGVENVVVTGGEPCLISYLPTLLRHAKGLGLAVVLSTNGTVFEKRVDEIAPHLDWIGLPLDAPSHEINRLMRPGDDGQLDSIVRLLPRLRRDHPGVRIKLGTVVCKLNQTDVAGIPRVLGEDRPDVWKLYQVIYSSYAVDNRDLVELTDAEFEQTVAAAAAAADAWGVRLVLYRRCDRAGTYLFIEPDGDMLVAQHAGERRVGNIFTDALPELAQRWTAELERGHLDYNVETTYPGLGTREWAVHLRPTRR